LKVRTRIKAFLDLLKPELPIAAGICVIAGEIIGLGHVPTMMQLFLGFLTGFLISGSAMMPNDYFDIEVDRVNNPNRPLPWAESVFAKSLFSHASFRLAGFWLLPSWVRLLFWPQASFVQLAFCTIGEEKNLVCRET